MLRLFSDAENFQLFCSLQYLDHLESQCSSQSCSENEEISRNTHRKSYLEEMEEIKHCASESIKVARNIAKALEVSFKENSGLKTQNTNFISTIEDLNLRLLENNAILESKDQRIESLTREITEIENQLKAQVKANASLNSELKQINKNMTKKDKQFQLKEEALDFHKFILEDSKEERSAYDDLNKKAELIRVLENRIKESDKKLQNEISSKETILKENVRLKQEIEKLNKLMLENENFICELKSKKKNMKCELKKIKNENAKLLIIFEKNRNLPMSPERNEDSISETISRQSSELLRADWENLGEILQEEEDIERQRWKFRAKTVLIKETIWEKESEKDRRSFEIEAQDQISCFSIETQNKFSNQEQKKDEDEIPEYFILIIQAARLKSPYRDLIENIPIKTMFKAIKESKVPFYDWYDWILNYLHCHINN